MATTNVEKVEVKVKHPLIDRLEKKFSNYPKLRLSKFLKKNVKDLPLKEFIYNFLTQWNNEYETRDIESDEDFDTLETKRSLEDIYSICKYYYPDCKLKDLLQCLFELCSENKIFGKWYCHTICKYVFSAEYTAYDRFTVRRDIIAGNMRMTTYDVFKELGFKQSDFKNKYYNNTKRDERYNQLED